MADKDFKVKNKLFVNGLSHNSGVILATNNNLDSHTNVPTQYGGTGTTQSPNAGQVLFSSAGTNYVPTTLTSLDVKGSSYSADAPTSPVVGQIWVESDSAATAFDPNIVKRQSFTATAAQTVFTTSHTWIEGYEQVYLNGLLLLRTTDYTTSNSNTVTLVEAAAVNDILEVVTVTNFNVNVSGYTQDAAPESATDGQIWLDTNGTLADAAFIPNTLTTTTGDIIYASAANTPARLGIGSSGQYLSVSGGVPSWQTNSQGWTLLSTTNHSGNATCTITGISTAYKNLRILVKEAMSSSTAGALYLDVGQASFYSQQAFWTNGSAQTTSNTLFQVSGGQAFVNLTGTSLRSANGDSIFVIDLYDYKNTTTYKMGRWTAYYLQGANHGEMTSGWFTANDLAAVTQIILQLQGGANLSATVEIYGEN